MGVKRKAISKGWCPECGRNIYRDLQIHMGGKYHRSCLRKAYNRHNN